MIVKLNMCTTGKILVEMPVPVRTGIYIYIYITLHYTKFKFNLKPYLKNLAI